MILDEQVGEKMNAIVLGDLQHCEQITLTRFRQRPWTERIAERAAHLIARVL